MDNINSLAREIKTVSKDKTATQLSGLLLEWKSDNSNVDDLIQRTEKFIGTTWIESDKEHEIIYKMWSDFRDQIIKGIGGMTMNERLFHFDLFDRFDSGNSNEKDLVYRKLKAKK